MNEVSNELMNEEQIIDKVSMIVQWKVSGDSYTQGELDAIGQLLELYYDNKKQLEQEKEKYKELYEALERSSSRVTELTVENSDLKYQIYHKQQMIKEIINEYKNVKIPGVREFFEKIEKMLLEEK